MMDIGKYFDIYSFFGSPVGSPDIAAHLKKIGYEFSALELAWIVCQSTGVPLSKRHSAYETILNVFPDEPLSDYEDLIDLPPDGKIFTSGLVSPDMTLHDAIRKEILWDNGRESEHSPLHKLSLMFPTPFQKGDIVQSPYARDGDAPLLLLEDYRPVNDDRCREYSSVFPIEAHCLSFGGRMLRTEDVEYLWLSFYRGEAFPPKR